MLLSFLLELVKLRSRRILCKLYARW